MESLETAEIFELTPCDGEQKRKERAARGPRRLPELDRRERQTIAEEMREIARAHAAAVEFWGNDRTRSMLNEADRFEQCGDLFSTLCCVNDFTKYHVPHQCRSRVCPECGRSLYRRLVSEIAGLVDRVIRRRRKGYFLQLVTLTFNKARWGEDLPDRDQIVRCYRESAQFLKRHFGKYYCTVSKSGRIREDRKRYRGAGWIAVCEVGADNNNFHVHAVVYGHYESYARMQEDWARITGDSTVINFKRVHSPRTVANYVLKYVTKPPESESYSRMAQYAWLIKGTRRIRTGGVFFNRVQLRKSKLKICCPECGGRLEFVGNTRSGFSDIVLLIPLLRQIESISKKS